MKILYLAHRIPFPPNKGEKIRAFHQIKFLSKRHAVHLVCFVDDPEDLQHIDALRQYCASVHAVYRPKRILHLRALMGALTGQSLSVAAFYSKSVQQYVDTILRTARIERVFVFSSSMAEYVLPHSDIPRVMDFVDVDSDKWRMYAERHGVFTRWLYKLEACRLAKYEARVAAAFDVSVLISSMEAELFKQAVLDCPIVVLPNGVDLDYFRPQHTSQDSMAGSPTMVFTGAMDYFPNVDAVQYFVHSVFPLIRMRWRGARFLIVGRNPSPEVWALQEVEGVTVTGAVADIRPRMAEAQVAVAPFRIARGIQNKVLEAMAMGLPVVGTSAAFRGLRATEKNGIRSVETPEGMAKEINMLFEDAPRRHELGLQARLFVEEFHRWDDLGEVLEKLIMNPQGQSGLRNAC
ncbi:MAG: TIGR03087 family PEP-CTERM/XrtA system glycosyltransferase [Nitrospira sp.]|jgi:sugar transferase (PEP-CTERM/EpsH1 system associated)